MKNETAIGGDTLTAAAASLPVTVQAKIARGLKEFAVYQQSKKIYRQEEMVRTLTAEQKLRHSRYRLLDVIIIYAKEYRGRGQPQMTERLCNAAIVVDALEADGIPFAVGRNSKMNKAVQRLLNDMADPTDDRKSRRKKITPDAVRVLLKDIRKLKMASKFALDFPPYLHSSPD
jgi:hypothetical protein